MSLTSISPLDGRYQAQVAGLANYFSEYALIRYRVLVAVRWLLCLSDRPELPSIRPFADAERATPSTLGKELAVFVYRWRRQLGQLRQAEYLGKLNGAVGTYSAHVVAEPNAPWIEISRAFVESLGLSFNPLTTQIDPHDY